MQYLDENNYKWKFKGYSNDVVTLFNKHENRQIEISKRDLQEHYKRMNQLDRNGFRIDDR